ncbi:MAG: peptide deformylase [Burkholderiales bacterium]|nr:peptide deformylase [Burkholderiales bacterium]
MIREVLTIGDELLTQISSPVQKHEFGTKELHAIITDLRDTQKAKTGVGLSAPQIGYLKRIFCIEYENSNPRYKDLIKEPQPFLVLINPVITPIGEETTLLEEGCLSVPNYRQKVMRAAKIKYSYYDYAGNFIEAVACDFLAKVLQHENDHLNGILLPLRVGDTDYIKQF